MVLSHWVAGRCKAIPWPTLTLGKPDSSPAWAIESLPCRDSAARHGSGGRTPAHGAWLRLLIALMGVKQVKVEAWGLQNAFGFEGLQKEKKKKKEGNLCT